MGCDFDQLHIWHHGRPQGCGIASPWRIFIGAGQCVDNIDAKTCGVFVDTAHVSLQWLVFPMDPIGHYWHACVFASGPRRAYLERAGRSWCDASMWRAHCHVAVVDM